jgi:maleylpyruvate isomerase
VTAFAADRFMALLPAQTDGVVSAAEALDAAAVPAPSLLPGWSRGHVLTHLARNADGLANLASTATTGVPQPMYASRQARDEDIERGAGRPVAELVLDLRSSAGRLAAALRAVPVTEADVTVPTGLGTTMAVRDLPWIRLREIAYHHVDLDVGFTFDDLPDEVLQAGLVECERRLSASDGGRTVSGRLSSGQQVTLTALDDGPAVRGPAGAVLGWLTGRTAGAGLATDDGSPLPAVPAWG